MNSIEAKKINLPDLMAKLGYQPTSIKKNGREYWYRSPFRPDKEASFHATYMESGKWVWYDFGDENGTVIDFVMRHENYAKVADALKFLDRYMGKVKTGTKLVFSQQQRFPILEASETQSNKELEFLSAKPIQNPLIINYLTQERGINKAVAQKYLEEIHYKNLTKQKVYFAYGIKNQSEGYEIRVASDKYPFKSALLKKDISLLQGIKPNSKIVNLFEGMTDFLSLLTMMNTQQLTGDSIILHSTKLLDKAIQLIEQKQYTIINGFLDNDKTGSLATDKLKAKFGDQFTDQSPLFHPYKDLNEFLKQEVKSVQKTTAFSR